MARTNAFNTPLDSTGPTRQMPDALCRHTPRCPTADSPDREAADAVASYPEQGWSLLCNGVLIFDTGELLPDGSVITPRRATGNATQACTSSA